MKSYSFRTARKGAYLSVQKLGAGVLVIGLALTAGARDGSTTVKDQVPSVKDQAQAKRAEHKPRRWYQIGIASWYGSQFQGRTTANGEEFDMNRMTCAHPTLPMGTWLRVTNLRNRRSTFVRVNDRGPLVDGRIVDLSAAAARVLGLSGIGKVKLEPVRENDPDLTRALEAQLKLPSLLGPLPQR